MSHNKLIFPTHNSLRCSYGGGDAHEMSMNQRWRQEPRIQKPKMYSPHVYVTGKQVMEGDTIIAKTKDGVEVSGKVWWRSLKPPKPLEDKEWCINGPNVSTILLSELHDIRKVK